MCFSATASFVSAAGLVTVGLYTMKRAQGSSYKSIAAIPHLFGIQQAFEGFVWLGLEQERFAPYTDLCAYGFLIFAWIIWPMYIPYTMKRAEVLLQRRNLMEILIAVGTVVAIALSYVMIFKGFEPQIRGNSIYYNVKYASPLSGVLSILYLLCTIVPALIGSGKKVWILGVTTLVMYGVAKFFFEEHLLSVWCFFAGIGSLLVLWVVQENTKITKAEEDQH